MTFELAVFAWAGPDRLDIGGRWRGVRAGELEPPELVVRHDGRTVRLAALAREGPEPPPSEQWSASFEWKAGPVALDAPRLEFPDGKVVELPALRPSRLRFGRQRLGRAQRDVDPIAEELDETAGAPAPPTDSAPPAAEEPPHDDSGDALDQPEVLRLHGELARLNDELQALSEELERAREDAGRARHDAQRASERRAADAERLHGDMETTWALARKAIAAEHDARERAEEALARTAADLEAARAEQARLSEELTATRDRAERDARRVAEAQDEARVAGERHGRLRSAVMAIAQQLDPALEQGPTASPSPEPGGATSETAGTAPRDGAA